MDLRRLFPRFIKIDGFDSNSILPDFLCIGVQKGGTTTLHSILEVHPDIFVPPEKELHYFSKNYCNSASWYSSFFRNSVQHQICGEFTPYYIFHPHVPQRVFNLIPDVRIIILLRDPVARSISQYFHSCRLGLESLCIEDAFQAEVERLKGSTEVLSFPSGLHRGHQEHSYLSRSRYENQIPEWTKYFPSKNILVLKSEDLFISKREAVDAVYKFLGVKNHRYSKSFPMKNAGLGEFNTVSNQFTKMLRSKLSNTYEWVYKEYNMSWPDPC